MVEELLKSRTLDHRSDRVRFQRDLLVQHILDPVCVAACCGLVGLGALHIPATRGCRFHQNRQAQPRLLGRVIGKKDLQVFPPVQDMIRLLAEPLFKQVTGGSVGALSNVSGVP